MIDVLTCVWVLCVSCICLCRLMLPSYHRGWSYNYSRVLASLLRLRKNVRRAVRQVSGSTHHDKLRCWGKSIKLLAWSDSKEASAMLWYSRIWWLFRRHRQLICIIQIIRHDCLPGYTPRIFNCSIYTKSSISNVLKFSSMICYEVLWAAASV